MRRAFLQSNSSGLFFWCCLLKTKCLHWTLLWRRAQAARHPGRAGRKPPAPPGLPGRPRSHSRFHLGLFLTGAVMWELHIENPLHEEDGIGVEVQLGARLPHHHVVGVGVQEDGDIPAPHQHLWAVSRDGVRRAATNDSSSRGRGPPCARHSADRVLSATPHDMRQGPLMAGN